VAVPNMPRASDDPAVRARFDVVEQLLARGEVRRALDVAKDLHKACGSPETEALLVRVYRARIEEMLRLGMPNEAKALVDLVQERYPASRAACAEVQERVVVRSGNAQCPLARLAAPDLPGEEREHIEAFIRRSITDPRQVADFAGLPATHPLRVEAAAVVRALDAVTSRTVTDADLALPEVSRHSPFAPWKFLVRAVAHFHARQDDECRKCLAAIAFDSAPARLTPVLHGLIEGRAPANAAPAAAKLVVAVTGDTSRLRQALANLDAAFRSGRQRAVMDAIAEAVRECRRQRPELLDRLRQHISACAMVVDIPAESVRNAMGGASVKDAYFWRLFARAAEKRAETEGWVELFGACSGWEEFRRHAVHQGWFGAGGAEEAAVCLHMADLLAPLPLREYEVERDEMVRGLKKCGGMASYYRPSEHQPPSVMACVPPAPPETYFLYPEQIFGRACHATPSPELFRRWLDWAKANDQGDRAADDVAEAWHTACPTDPRPLLVLTENAEARDALGKALKYLTAAEELDGMNVEVRRARPRLLVATALRHLRKKQHHLVEKDLAELGESSQMAEGDWPALIEALRWAAHAIPSCANCVDWGMERLVAAAGDRLTATYLVHLVAHESKAFGLDNAVCDRLLSADVESAAFLRAAARARLLCEAMHLRFGMPEPWADALPAAVRCGDGNLSEAQLRALAGFVLGCGTTDSSASPRRMASTGYCLAGYGLKRPDADHARFLFLRGKSLLIEDARAPQRGLECLRAARMLAARRRDMVLVEEALDVERRYRYLVRNGSEPRGATGDHLNLMSAEQLQRVLATERESTEFPVVPAPAPARGVRQPARSAAAPPPKPEADRRQGVLPGLEELDNGQNELGDADDTGDDAEVDDELDEDEDLAFLDDDFVFGAGIDDDDEGPAPDMPPAILNVYLRLVAKYGEEKADRLLSMPDALARKEPKLLEELMWAFEELGLGGGGFMPPEPRRGKRK